MWCSRKPAMFVRVYNIIQNVASYPKGTLLSVCFWSFGEIDQQINFKNFRVVFLPKKPDAVKGLVIMLFKTPFMFTCFTLAINILHSYDSPWTVQSWIHTTHNPMGAVLISSGHPPLSLASAYFAMNAYWANQSMSITSLCKRLCYMLLWAHPNYGIIQYNIEI